MLPLYKVFAPFYVGYLHHNGYVAIERLFSATKDFTVSVLQCNAQEGVCIGSKRKVSAPDRG